MELRPGRPEAADAIWNWQAPSEPEQPPEPASRARLRGFLQGLAVAGVGTLIFLFASAGIGTIVLAVAAIVLGSALASPTRLYAGIERLLDALGRATGRALTWILLVPLFYGFFFPFGALFRRGRRDRLKRIFEVGADSYWEAHPVRGSRERQY